jgi:hypothetical protein
LNTHEGMMLALVSKYKQMISERTAKGYSAERRGFLAIKIGVLTA